MSRSAPTLTVAAVATLLLVAATAPVAVSAHGSAEPSFAADLAADGSATVTVTYTYDLNSDDERDAFQQLRDDSSAREDARTRFRDRMASVASDAENATGREMSVTDASIELATSDDGDLGIVELSVQWSGMAAVENGELVVTKPFASGFEPDRKFTVAAPDGYQITGATPEPDSTAQGSASWNANTDLSGFELTATESDGSGGDGTATTPGGDSSGSSAPGFGALAALGAVLAVAALAGRRR